ncbi:transposon-transfer assisting family protein [Novisyntrophococcus fermenticellae]|uniref:transposon-transfer assisting family protein n=1 Tax=Novisyntrophococcus fermenticellae TaxID=2068655 RepID=UPI001E65E191|nr:transposon-transfer assisting family protein [Novisyntrophococcus fermenticellae]
MYNEGGKQEVTANITAALPYMDAAMRELAVRTLEKIAPLSEAEYAELAVYAADEI